MEVSRNKSDFKLYGQQVGKLVRRSQAGLLNLLISMMGKPEKGFIELNNLFTGFYPPPAIQHCGRFSTHTKARLTIFILGKNKYIIRWGCCNKPDRIRKAVRI